MDAVTDGAAVETADSPVAADYNFTGAAVVAALVGIALAWPARVSALALLVAVAAAQALFAFSWVFGLRLPGRKGALVIAAMCAGFADTAVSVWPHSRLGTLLAVFALAMPVLFVHQLMRGAARVRVLESLGCVAILVMVIVSLPALLQLRHEFSTGAHGGDITVGVVVVVTGALIVGYLVDLIFAAPRFDADVPRGLVALLASTAVAALLGQLTLRDLIDFSGGRAVFVGAALGALVALFAVATAFLEHGVAMPDSGFGRRARPVIGVLLPVCLIAPIAFLLCLAVRA